MSLRKSINSMCRQCIYDDESPGNWIQQIDACTSPKCPLFSVRPRSRGMIRVTLLAAETDADAQPDGAHQMGKGGSE